MSENGTRVRSVHVLVHGTVQGVGFRYHCAYTAQDLGVVGQVRNLPDGDVEVMAQGEPGAVARLISWLRHGHRWAVSAQGHRHRPARRLPGEPPVRDHWMRGACHECR